MKKLTIFLYGAGSYLIFLATFLYAIGFIGNFAVPKSLDSPQSVPVKTALLIDLGLLSIFAVQHSVMARPAFKRLLTQVIPASAERSTYVLASSLALADRTLQRRLHEEQTSFQELLDGARRELAGKYLADGQYSLGQVADLLGFVDQSNFFRACKRWFGVTPTQYRQRLAGDRVPS